MSQEIKIASRRLTKGDLTELKSLNNPPKCVQDVILCMMYFDPMKDKAYEYGIKWELMRSTLAQPSLLQQLKSYKKETMTHQMYYQIATILRSYKPFLDAAKVKSVSCSAVPLFEWIIAQMKYFGDNNDVNTMPSPIPIKTEHEREFEQHRYQTESDIEAFENRLSAQAEAEALKLKEEEEAEENTETDDKQKK